MIKEDYFMSEKLSNKYNPQEFEEKLYQEWEEKGEEYHQYMERRKQENVEIILSRLRK